MMCYNIRKCGARESMKKVLKFKFIEQEGFLSVVEKDDAFYALVKKDTPKVGMITQTHRLLISYELKNPIFQDVFVEVINDQDVIKSTYQTLQQENNLYFKELDDSLCVLKIEK